MNLDKRQSFKNVIFIAAVSISSVSCANESNGENKDAAKNSSAVIENPISHGEQAHNNHCYKCHTDEVYTRENRFVKSLDALSKQVVRCKDGSNIPWFDEDTDAVVQFLNKKYYLF